MTVQAQPAGGRARSRGQPHRPVVGVQLGVQIHRVVRVAPWWAIHMEQPLLKPSESWGIAYEDVGLACKGVQNPRLHRLNI